MNYVTKTMGISIVINIFLSLIKIISGIIYTSGALIADGIHSLSDLLTDFFAIIGNVISKKPADKDHPYGHGQIEYLTSVGISLVILFLGFSIISNSMKSEVVTSSFVVSIVSLITIILKYLLSSYIIKNGKKYKNNILIASGKESRADVISSLVVFISALLGILSKYIGFLKYSDKIAAVIVGILIIKTGFLILKDNISILLGKQDAEESKGIRDILLKNEFVKTIDNIIVLKFGYCYNISIEISMDSKLELQLVHDIIEDLERQIKKQINNAEYVMIHVSPYKETVNYSIEDTNDNYKTNDDYIKKSVKNENTKMIVINNEIVGIIKLYKKEKYFYIEDLYINEKYRNIGIRTNIIKNIISDDKKIKILISKTDIQIFNLYRNLGFEIEKETKTNYEMKFN